MSAAVIYTASDLDRKRREVTDAARRGVARIRDTDGMGPVLLPGRSERRFLHVRNPESVITERCGAIRAA